METLQPKMLRAKGIAQMFDVGLTSVWGYSKKGFFKRHSITPGLTLFDVSECEAFFKGRQMHKQKMKTQETKNEKA